MPYHVLPPEGAHFKQRSCRPSLIKSSLPPCLHSVYEYERWEPFEMCEVTEVLRLRTPSLPPDPPGPPPDAVLLRGWGLFLRAIRLGVPRTPKPPPPL